tara:strand:+ start:3754 stop:4083 length:330 start_codon:yes stop_codon:yes gene_type:complete
MDREVKKRKSVHTFRWTDETVIDFVKENISIGSISHLYLVKAIENFKNSERNKDIVWIKENKELLSIAGIEKAAGLPETSLLKAVNGGQKFPKKWEAKLNQFVKKIKSK